MRLCLSSPWWAPCVFLRLPWCCDNLRNYCANWAPGWQRVCGSSTQIKPAFLTLGPSKGVPRLIPKGSFHVNSRFGKSAKPQNRRHWHFANPQEGQSLFHASALCCLCAADMAFPAVTFQTRCHLRATAEQAHVPVWLIRYPSIWRQNINSFSNPIRTRCIEIWRWMTFNNWGCATLCKAVSLLKCDFAKPAVRLSLQGPYSEVAEPNTFCHRQILLPKM